MPSFEVTRSKIASDGLFAALDVPRPVSFWPRHVELVGLMDVEVMVDGDVPRVIEIDARLPSRTPMIVYHAPGRDHHGPHQGIRLLVGHHDLYGGGCS